MRIGVIGSGSVSHAYLAQAELMSRRGQIELVAACDIVPDQALHCSANLACGVSLRITGRSSTPRTLTWCWS